MSDQQINLDVPGATPDHGPPPRQVEPWTRVQGHVITRGSVNICSCGAWRSDGRRNAGSLEDHLKDAWPILISREDGNADPRAWAERVELALQQALEHEEVLHIRGGHDRPTLPGEATPLMTQELTDAGCRVEVLEHQLDDLRARIIRSGGGR